MLTSRASWAGIRGGWFVWQLGILPSFSAILSTYLGFQTGRDEFVVTVIGSFLFCCIYLIWFLLAFACTVKFLQCVWRKEWRQCSRLSVMPLMLAAYFLPKPFSYLNPLHASVALEPVVHLLHRKAYFDSEIQKIHEPRHAIFDVNGMSFAFDEYVYDDSDQWILPTNKQKSTYQKYGTIYSSGLFIDVQPLWGHYYHVEIMGS